MNSEDEIKQEVGELQSGSGWPPMRRALPLGSADAESRMVALEASVQALYRGLMLAGRQIQELRDRLDRS